MTFEEILRRYHIEPLKYEDGTLLNDRDYKTLYDILSRWYAVKKYSGENIAVADRDNIISTLQSKFKNVLISPQQADMMDVLMGFKEEKL